MNFFRPPQSRHPNHPVWFYCAFTRIYPTLSSRSCFLSNSFWGHRKSNQMWDFPLSVRIGISWRSCEFWSCWPWWGFNRFSFLSCVGKLCACLSAIVCVGVWGECHRKSQKCFEFLSIAAVTQAKTQTFRFSQSKTFFDHNSTKLFSDRMWQAHTKKLKHKILPFSEHSKEHKADPNNDNSAKTGFCMCRLLPLDFGGTEKLSEKSIKLFGTRGTIHITSTVFRFCRLVHTTPSRHRNFSKKVSTVFRELFSIPHKPNRDQSKKQLFPSKPAQGGRSVDVKILSKCT